MQMMSVDEPVWEDHHHRSSFLPNSSSVDFDLVSLISTDIVSNPQTLVLLQDTDFEGNLCNITKTIPIDIPVKPRTIEHILVRQNYLKKETSSYRALFKDSVIFFPRHMRLFLGSIR